MENAGGKLLRLAGIINESVVDGPGIRAVVFAQGCRHHCKGCQNPHTHSFEGGRLMAVEEVAATVTANPLISGVTFSGGDPFEQAGSFALLARLLKTRKLSVMTYTGYTFEELILGLKSNPGWRNLLERTDILVDGRFELEKKDSSLAFRGSANQRIIDVPKTLATGEITVLGFGREALRTSA